MNKDYLFNSIIDSYIENFSDVDLIDDKRNYNDYIDIKETFQIVGDFLKDNDEDIYNIFINIVNNTPNRFRIYSSEISNEYANYSDPINNQIAITPKYTIEDAYVIVHELYHYIDSTKNKVKNNLIYSETSSMTMELYLFDYLTKNNIHFLDSYNYIYNSIFRNMFDVYYYKYYEFKQKYSSLNILKKIAPNKYSMLLKTEINKLDSKLKKVFLKHYKEFDKRIEEDGITASYNIKHYFIYTVGSFLRPYLLAKKDKKLISDINKASYDDSIIVPKFDVTEVKKYYDKFNKRIANLGLKYPKYLPKYDLNNYDELVYSIINNIPENYNTEMLDYQYSININDIMMIVRNFLEWFDSDLLNIFNNTISFDKNSFKFVINNKGSFMLMDTGEVVCNLKGTIADAFTIIHEFTHKLDYTKINADLYPFDKTKISNYGEIVPITMELYLYDYLKNDINLKHDATVYIKNMITDNIEDAYFMYFIGYIHNYFSLNFSDINRDTLDKEYFINDIKFLPKNIRENFIKEYDKYMDIIEYLNNYKDIRNTSNLDIANDFKDVKEFINHNIPYKYAFLLAPYLKELNNDFVLNKINRASYNLEDELDNIDKDNIIKEYKLFLNELENNYQNIKNNSIKSI